MPAAEPDAAAAAAAAKPALQKPPGYRDAAAATAAQTRGPPPPPPRKIAQLPPTLRHPGKPMRRRQQRGGGGGGRSLCCRLCCCLFLIFFTAIFLTAVAAALSYLYFRPRVPSLRLQSLNLTQFNVSARADGSGTFLDAAAAVKIFASNPNSKFSLSYGDGDVRMYVYDEDDDISFETRPFHGFFQEKGNATVLRFAAGVKGLLVDDSVGARMRARFRSRELRFGVEVRTKVGARVKGVTVRRVPVRVQCRPVSLRQLKGGRTALPKCAFYLFRWINLH